MENNNPPQDNGLNIELSEDMSEGVYSNLALITHSNSEFVVDFIQVMPNVPKAKVRSRVIITPQHAKRLLAALKDNVGKFEAAYGTIIDPQGNDPMPTYPMNFGGPPAQA